LEEFKQCVAAILPQLTDETELLISDNSPDNLTQDYVTAELLGKENVRYNHNQVNLGADGNFLYLMKNARGKYFLLIGDDDKPADDAYIKLVEFLKRSEEVAVCFLNAIGLNNNLDMPDAPISIRESEKLYSGIPECGEFLRKAGIMMTFMSSLVFNKRVFDEMESPERFMNTNLIQSHIFVAMLGILPKAAYLPEVVIFGRGENSSGYNVYTVFVCNWYDVLFSTARKSGFKKRILRKVFNDTLGGHILGLISLERQNKLAGFSTGGRFKAFLRIIGFRYAWTRVLPLWLMPQWLFRIMYKAHKKRKSRLSAIKPTEVHRIKEGESSV
jgi:glycosyltransferase involved in cell wall biosynthesis